MPTLHDTQEQFLAAVLGRDPEAAAPWPRLRLAVYPFNARVNFAGALAASFPRLPSPLGHDECPTPPLFSRAPHERFGRPVTGPAPPSKNPRTPRPTTWRAPRATGTATETDHLGPRKTPG